MRSSYLQSRSEPATSHRFFGKTPRPAGERRYTWKRGSGTTLATLLEAINIKRKMFFEYENTPFACMDSEISTPTARGGQTLVRLKMRNLLTSAVLDKTFKAGDKFKEPDCTVPVSYLYSDGDGSYFLDQDNFETLNLPAEIVRGLARSSGRRRFAPPAQVQRQSHQSPVADVRRAGSRRSRTRRTRRHLERQRDQDGQTGNGS